MSLCFTMENLLLHLFVVGVVDGRERRTELSQAFNFRLLSRLRHHGPLKFALHRVRCDFSVLPFGVSCSKCLLKLIELEFGVKFFLPYLLELPVDL